MNLFLSILLCVLPGLGFEMERGKGSRFLEFEADGHHAFELYADGQLVRAFTVNEVARKNGVTYRLPLPENARGALHLIAIGSDGQKSDPSESLIVP